LLSEIKVIHSFIQYKLSVTKFNMLTTELSVWIDPVSYPITPPSVQQLPIQQDRVTEWVFCHAAPAVCNLFIPQFITSNISSFTCYFKLLLKTVYFNRSLLAVNDKRFFSAHLRFFTIVNDFSVRHTPTMLRLRYCLFCGKCGKLMILITWPNFDQSGCVFQHEE